MLQSMKKIDADVNRPSDKKKLIIIIEKRTGQLEHKKKFSGLLFTPLWSIPNLSLKQIYHSQ